jgi:hypothetical protein
MHTENVTSTELIRAAVVAQLEKPAVTPSAFWSATRTIRFQILAWMGIIAGSLSLFTNLQSLLIVYSTCYTEPPPEKLISPSKIILCAVVRSSERLFDDCLFDAGGGPAIQCGS